MEQIILVMSANPRASWTKFYNRLILPPNRKCSSSELYITIPNIITYRFLSVKSYSKIQGYEPTSVILDEFCRRSIDRNILNEIQGRVNMLAFRASNGV